MNALARAFGLAVLLVACEDDDRAKLSLVDGAYAQNLEANKSDFVGYPAHPLANGIAKTLVVDRANAKVTITYKRDGKTVVERWRMGPVQ